MNILNLFKKKPKKAMKRLYIPEDKIVKFYELIDKLDLSNLNRYYFWKFIGEVFPETRDRDCRIGRTKILAPYIEYEDEETAPISIMDLRVIIDQGGYTPTDKLDTSKPPAGGSVVPSVSPDAQAISNAIKSLNPNEKT